MTSITSGEASLGHTQGCNKCSWIADVSISLWYIPKPPSVKVSNRLGEPALRNNRNYSPFFNPLSFARFFAINFAEMLDVLIKYTCAFNSIYHKKSHQN